MLLAIPREIIKNYKLIISLAKNDFKTRFAGSYFGIMWAFVNPIVTVLLYWFVFGFVFAGARGNGEYPYVIYLVSGLVPWFMFQEALTMGTNAMLDYSYLVKKVVFKIEVLPMVKVLASTFVHLFFVLFAIIMFSVMGYIPGVYTIQLLYYLLCLWAFTLTLVYCTSAVVLFFRDLGQIINIFMQVFMWMVPILWNESQFESLPRVLTLLKLNPMYYVITGYRDALIDGRWFYERPVITLYFWSIVLVMYVIGVTIFRRLRPHFADVL